MPSATRTVLAVGAALLIMGSVLVAYGTVASVGSQRTTELREALLADNATIVSKTNYTTYGTALLAAYNMTIDRRDPLGPNGLRFEYTTSPGIALPPEIIEGSISLNMSIPVAGGQINLYLMNEENFTRWNTGQSFGAYLINYNWTSGYFMGVLLGRESAVQTLYYVVEKANASQPDPSLTLWANAIWRIQGSTTLPSMRVVLPAVGVHVGAIRLYGNATEVHGLPFYFYILDQTNFSDWAQGLPFVSIFEARSATYVTVAVALPDTATSASALYFVAENPETAIQDLTVHVSAEVTWHVPVGSATAAVALPLGWGSLLVGAATSVVGSTMAGSGKRPRPPTE